MIKFKIKIPKTPWKEFRCFFGFHKRRDNDAETFMWLPHGGGSMSRVHARTCQDCGRPYQHPEE